jgi:hypothetical protein
VDNNIQIISALTGLVGTIGGVLISYLTLRHTFNKDRHRVIVDLSSNILMNVPGIDSKREQFTITVANLGQIPFTVANIRIRVGHRSGALFIPMPTGTHQIPTTLDRDQTCNFWTDHKEALKSIENLAGRNKIKIRAQISDFAGNEFHSRWMPIRFKETFWSKLIAKLKTYNNYFLKLVRP